MILVGFGVIFSGVGVFLSFRLLSFFSFFGSFDEFLMSFFAFVFSGLFSSALLRIFLSPDPPAPISLGIHDHYGNSSDD